MGESMLPQVLKPAGYVCGAVGKWHLGSAPNFRPLQRGFDEFFGFLGAQSTYYNARVFRNDTQITETAYLTDAFTREGVSFINRHATEPFFLYLAYNAVHRPYDTPPASYINRVAGISDPQRRTFAGMVTALDDGVGQVLQALKNKNIFGKTLIFFLSDNGAPDKSFVRNLPFRGYKGDVLEGGIHVPFAVQWPGRLPAQALYKEPLSSLDIVATASAAAGISLPADRVYDGLNIIPFLAGEQVSPQRTLFWRWFGLGQDGPPGSQDTIWAVRKDPFKLVTERAASSESPALYNLSIDQGETRNLAVTQPGTADSLKRLYTEWNIETAAPLWTNETYPNFIPLVLAGDWNAYNKGDSASPWRLTRVTAPGLQGPPDGLNWFSSTVYVAATGNTTPGLHSFALVGDGSYSKQWGGATITIDGTTSVPFFSGTALGRKNNISLQDGYYYSFRVLEWSQQVGASMQLAVMKTSAPPVSVSRSGQTPVTPSFKDPIIVSISTSQPKSIQERVYLRWSTDSFITSHIVNAVGSGSNYSATIPPQVAGTAVQYCIVTSTSDLSAFSTSGIIDPLILATSGVFKVITSDPRYGRMRPTRTLSRWF